MAGGGALQQAVAQDNGGSSSVQASNTTAPALTSDQMNAMAAQKLADSQRSAYMLSSTPIQQYYNPAAQQSVSTQSPTLRIPGYQGVRNPFVSQYATAQPQARTQQSAAQVANLLNQTNQYKQTHADQLYQAQQANQTQLAAMQKAYQDKQAADRAAAEAAAAQAQMQQQQQSMMNPFGGSSYAANGGIADLQKGFER